MRGTYLSKEVFLRLSLLLCRYDAVDDNIIRVIGSDKKQYMMIIKVRKKFMIRKLIFEHEDEWKMWYGLSKDKKKERKRERQKKENNHFIYKKIKKMKDKETYKKKKKKRKEKKRPNRRKMKKKIKKLTRQERINESINI